MSFYSLRKTVNPHLPGNKKKIVEDLLNDLNKDLIKIVYREIIFLTNKTNNAISNPAINQIITNNPLHPIWCNKMDFPYTYIHLNRNRNNPNNILPYNKKRMDHPHGTIYRTNLGYI